MCVRVRARRPEFPCSCFPLTRLFCYLWCGTLLDLRDREVKESKHTPKLSAVSQNEEEYINEAHLALAPLEDASPMDRLPSEVLMRILDHLSTPSLVSCMLVCKKWSRVIQHPFLWLYRSKGVVLRKEVGSGA
jgi:F-box-like